MASSALMFFVCTVVVVVLSNGAVDGDGEFVTRKEEEGHRASFLATVTVSRPEEELDATKFPEVLSTVAVASSGADRVQEIQGSSLFGDEVQPTLEPMKNFMKEKSCSEDEIMCDDGAGCYHKMDRCDGSSYCFDGSDEKDCNMTCTADQFRCHDVEECILNSKLCNHFNDCKDGSDEKDCDEMKKCHSTDDFECKNGKCIMSHLRCDGINHCDDNSDETNCTNHKLCPAKYFDCHGDGRKCIPTDDVCNGVDDCENREDEEDCRSLGRGEDGDDGDDDEERGCHEVHCHHNCHMKHEKYICSCQEGFHLAEDGFSCRVDGSEPLLLLANGTKVIGYGLYSKVIKTKHHFEHNVSNFALDVENRRLFWFSDQTRTIYMSQIGVSSIPSGSEVLVEVPVGHTVSSLAYDWSSSNLYWTEFKIDPAHNRYDSKIGVVALKKGASGEMFQTQILLSPEVDHPIQLVLDPRSDMRHLYWLQTGSAPGLYRADMDGSNVVPIASEYTERPVALVIDFAYETLYWMDAGTQHLYATSLGSSETSSILKLESHISQTGIASFESVLYWSSEDRGCEEFLGWGEFHSTMELPELEMVVSKSMAIDHPLVQQRVESSCKDNRGTCDHICLPSVPGHTCRCHETSSADIAYELSVDGSSCDPRGGKADPSPTIGTESPTERPDPSPAKEIEGKVFVPSDSQTNLNEDSHESKMDSSGSSGERDSKRLVHPDGTSSASGGRGWIYFLAACGTVAVLSILVLAAYKFKTRKNKAKVTTEREGTPLKERSSEQTSAGDTGANLLV